MGKVRVCGFAVSLDGYGAGSKQSLENPLGIRGTELHQWFFPTRMFQKMHGQGEGGSTGIDNDFAEKSVENIGAWIMGRNMFGPIRGKWPDDSWKGWWGENPPYHVPVFVLTHYPRKPLEMEGGTTFYFVSDGVEAVLKKAREAARGKDIRIGGGVSTVKQYLRANLIDEIHFAYSPIFLGDGENLFTEINLPALGFSEVTHRASDNALHVTLRRPK